MSHIKNINMSELKDKDLDKDLGEYSDCPICCEKRRVKSWVTCSSCKFSCCRGCIRKYILGSNNLTPDCMSCHVQWDFEFIAENMSSDFHNKEYRDFRTKLLCNREKSMLPATQELAIEEKRRRNLGSELEKLEIKRKELHALVVENNKKISEIRQHTRFHVWEQKEIGTEKVEKFRYIAHCPKNDCNGYVGENWRCGLCNQKVCGKCHQSKMSKKDCVKDKTTFVVHVCKKDDVDTAALLTKDTKPCPKCSVPIHKIEGCSQMFCTVCRTAFDWKTGKIETGRIHNPHYYAFQRQQNGGVAPRVEGDVRCGGAPNFSAILNHFHRLHIPRDTYMWLGEAMRIIDHIRHVELFAYPIHQGERVHLDLRVKYLLNELDEKKWITELKRREKKREKDRSIHLVLRMFVDTMSDMFTNLLDTKNTDQVSDIFVEMISLRDYANQNLKKVGDRFGNKVPFINDKWEYIGVGVNRGRRRPE